MEAIGKQQSCSLEDGASAYSIEVRGERLKGRGSIFEIGISKARQQAGIPL